MDRIEAYILSVCAAAIVCAIAANLGSKDGAAGKLSKMAAGLVLLFTVMQPLAQVKLTDPKAIFSELKQEAHDAAGAGQLQANNALAQRIKEQTEAYILDKAALQGANLQVEVVLSDDPFPKPEKALLRGDASPYLRARIGAMLEQDLGITGENQIWN